MISDNAMSDLNICMWELNMRESNEKDDEVGVPLATAEFCQTLFPHATQLDFNFQAVHQILVFWRLQFRKVTGKKLRKDTPKVPG